MSCLISSITSFFIEIKIAQRYAPSTKDVNSVTLAAFLLPAGKLRPIFSNFSLRSRPPFFDFALQI